MADDATTTPYKLERTITLSQLKPNEYRLWVVQTEATFQVHKCLDIVLGKEPNPTPTDDDGTSLGPIGEQLRTVIASWEIRHALAREALIKALQPADLLKVLGHLDSAASIWTRLRDEYGRRLDFEYIRVNSEFQSLRKTKEVTMDAHITRFNELLQELEYNKPTSIPALQDEAVNLQFLQSLGNDRDWELFAMAKGDSIRTLSTAELLAEVRALSARRTGTNTSTTSQPATSSPASQPDAARALSTRFDDSYHNGIRSDSGYSRGQHGFRGRGRGFGHGFGRGRGRGYGRGAFGGRNGKKKSSDYNPDKYCRHCQRVGHDIHVCRKYATEQEERKKNNSPHDAGHQGGSTPSSSRTEQYQPSLVRSYFATSANVTRFIANSSELALSNSNNTWVIDSAANAYITPFKSDLWFFIEENIGEVKGFGGKLETAEGKGSVILTDAAGNRVTLTDVCYVPSSQDRILSLMKFRREHSVDFHFTGPETFILSAANGFRLSGHSINDILQITLPQPQANVTVTRNLRKRGRIESSEDELSSDYESESEGFKRARTASVEPDRPDRPLPLTCSPANLWHLRFAHSSATSLSKLKSIRSTHNSRKCDICMRAKKTKNPFPRSTSKVSTQLGRVHSDICGPYPKSEGGAIYNLTFLDELTHYAFSAPISDRSSETVKCEFLQFVAAVERETGLKVKSLQSNEGSEYQGDLTPALQALEVKHEVTPLHTSELNGKAEHLNHILNNTIRAMLLQANMLQSF